MTTESDDTIRSVLDYRRVAVVGCSQTPGKAAHDVPAFLDRHGYDIVPVNPFADVVLDTEAADSLSDVDSRVEVVCVFRPSDEVAGIVDEALGRDDIEAIWTQLGIRDDAAANRAEAAGLTVIQDRCMKVEHGRLSA